MNSLDLYFTSSPTLQLAKTCFYFNYNPPLVTVRGKDFPHSGQTGSFLWSMGVKSLVYFLIESLSVYQMGSKIPFVLSGPKKSLAHSLSLTLIKEPNWLAEMFGTDLHGKSQAKNLILLRNQYYNLGDKVELSINSKFLELSEINVYLNNQKIKSTKNLIQIREALRATLQVSSSECSFGSGLDQLNFDFF